MGKSQFIIYYTEDKEKERQMIRLCEQLQIKTKRLSWTDINAPVGQLIGIKTNEAKINGIPGNVKAAMGYKIPEIMIFSGLSSEKLDEFLAEYKAAGILPIALKAVITPYNIAWTVYQLIQELMRERMEILSRMKR